MLGALQFPALEARRQLPRAYTHIDETTAALNCLNVSPKQVNTFQEPNLVVKSPLSMISGWVSGRAIAPPWGFCGWIIISHGLTVARAALKSNCKARREHDGIVGYFMPLQYFCLAVARKHQAVFLNVILQVQVPVLLFGDFWVKALEFRS